jgi:TRAP-type mannitol/chloroaromatic compound transport system permease small subunit
VSFLLRISSLIDWITDNVGRYLIWLLLGAVVISAGNAISRYAFSASNNAMLEVQWYLYSAVFILGSGYTLLKNQHVRIDLISNRISDKARNWVDVIGILVFLIPVAVMISWMSWHGFVDSYEGGEVSSNAGGLIRWPVRLLIPVGFALLALQAFSELIKRVAFLMGKGPDPLEKPPEHNFDIPHEEGAAK